MKKENLSKSLKMAEMYQNLIEVFRNVVKEELTKNDDINDGLTVVMMVGHNGLGHILVKLHEIIETTDERIDIFGDGDGFPKQTKAGFSRDGKEDFTDNGEEEEDDWHESDDPENYRDEWEIDDEED